MKRLFLIVCVALLTACHSSADVVFSNKSDLTVSLPQGEAEVVRTALDIFKQDYWKVFGRDVLEASQATLCVGTLGLGSPAEQVMNPRMMEELKLHPEAFALWVSEGKLYLLGSDKRGTAYGLMELSRLIGVSPWEWWADSKVERRKSLRLTEGFKRMEHPSVRHRGIFLNDEDWGLMPWSCQTHDPSDVKGRIGPKTHARIFELLLRLRANTFWPAMHDCSVAFYLVPGNKETADKYGIYVGTSHCEPMVRNTNAEWRTAGVGAYDYVHNRENVLAFWEERVKQLAGSDNIYTLGIRGVHDSGMLGAKGVQEQKEAMIRVLKDQREMIARHVNPRVEEVSQVFIPYKEVLDIYNQGLEVPEDVMLMWCDDNYGYIRHFPDAAERARKGGNGVYYHVSYWGRPHDYLWLATNHPAQLYTQMKLAYDKGAKDYWILNVGDIKPAEYLTELFLDMAWNMERIENSAEGLEKHLHDWMAREFGKKYADELTDIMNEYYRLAYIRKPEFMGNTRTEEKDPAYKVVKDLPWSKSFMERRLADYERLEERVLALAPRIPREKAEPWFQLVEYPVRGAARMNAKHLYASLARHGYADWAVSDAAHDTIVALTERYAALSDGKWRGIMDHRPRRLAVFDKVPHTEPAAPLPLDERPLFLLDGKEYADSQGAKPLAHGLGYRRGAISLPRDTRVAYDFAWEGSDSITVEVRLAPNHPVEGGQLRFAIALEGGEEQVVPFHTQGRSEEWKENNLRNQAIRRVTLLPRAGKKQRLWLRALDEGVVLDQVALHAN